jgi:hypothetical protein
MNRHYKSRLPVLGVVALVAIGAGAAAIGGGTEAREPLALRITITDPDSDDQSDAKLKTRQNADGTFRAKFEAEALGVEEARRYLIRLTIIDLETGASASAETPPLVAQPPR